MCCNSVVLFLLADTASPFILLGLKDPLDGMEGALFRSLLDIDCLHNLSHETPVSDNWGDGSPLLSLDESLDLIRRTGLDTNLLSLLGLEVDNPGHDEPCVFEMDKDTVAHLGVELEPHEETAQELEVSPPDTWTKADPEEDQIEQEQEHPSEVGRPQGLCLGPFSIWY